MVFNFEQKPGQTLEKKCMQEQITPRVSIVTPYYNSGRNFEETYRCVINQTMREFEWIIMDDGSSRKEDIELLERLGESDTRIHVFHQKNGGQSKAKNEAVKKTMTDIVVFLDADDLVEPFYIEYLYKALQEEPKVNDMRESKNHILPGGFAETQSADMLRAMEAVSAKMAAERGIKRVPLAVLSQSEVTRRMKSI